MLLTSSNIFLLCGLLASITFLCISAYYFVLSTEKTATLFAISPFIIGLVVVAFGTSLPEIVVVVFASLDGTSDLILGNIIGSNLANMALVLAISLIYFGTTISLSKQDTNLLLVMIAVTFMFAILAYVQSALTMVSGLLLLGFCIPFIFFLTLSPEYTTPDTDPDNHDMGSDNENRQGKLSWQQKTLTIFILLSSLGVLLASAEFTVKFAVQIAHAFDLSPHFIGLSVIALGTSSPEIVAGIMAIILRQPLIGISAVIGSNFFNITLGLGIGAMISDIAIETVTHYRDLPYLLGFTTVLLLLLIKKNYVYKMIGTTMVIGYLAYIYNVYLTEFT